jgi:uncharacterized Zn-finger protein
MGQNCESYIVDILCHNSSAKSKIAFPTVILNMADKGFKVCAYNRTTSKVDDFMANEAKGE